MSSTACCCPTETIWQPLFARGGLLSPRALTYHLADGDTETVTDVLRRIAAGDGEAVEDCLSRYGGLVWSLARRLSPSSADAEDAVQEIFIELWQKAERFDPEKASEKTFIAMIARRRLIDRLRRAGRRPEVELPDHDWALPATGEERRIERSAEASIAARYLEGLKPEQRKVLELSIYHGLTHSEIAATTGMPIGTVKSHIFRGLADVRRRVAEKDAT